MEIATACLRTLKLFGFDEVLYEGAGTALKQSQIFFDKCRDKNGKAWLALVERDYHVRTAELAAACGASDCKRSQIEKALAKNAESRNLFEITNSLLGLRLTTIKSGETN